MKTFLPLFIGFLAVNGCALNDEPMRRLEQEQARQGRILAEQTSLLASHQALLAQQIEGQQQVNEKLAGLERTLEKYRAERIRIRPRSKPAPETRLVVSTEGKAVLGRNEWAWFELLDRNLKARIDTGALTSSLNAVELQPFERDGKEWIRFRVPDEEHPDGGEIYEAPLVRHVRIRQASAEDLERRPVIELKVRIGELFDDTEFTLTNRENMLYPVLLGRNVLRDVAIVDVAQKFVQEKYTGEKTDTSK